MSHRALGPQFDGDPALRDLPPALGTAPLPEDHVRMYHQTPVENVPSIKEHGLLWDKGRAIEGPKGIWVSDKPFYGESPHLATVEIAVPHKDRQQMGRIASIGDVPPSRITTIVEPWHGRVRDLIEQGGYAERARAGEYDSIIDDGDEPDPDPTMRAIKHIRDAR